MLLPSSIPLCTMGGSHRCAAPPPRESAGSGFWVWIHLAEPQPSPSAATARRQAPLSAVLPKSFISIRYHGPYVTSHNFFRFTLHAPAALQCTLQLRWLGRPLTMWPRLVALSQTYGPSMDGAPTQPANIPPQRRALNAVLSKCNFERELSPPS